MAGQHECLKEGEIAVLMEFKKQLEKKEERNQNLMYTIIGAVIIQVIIGAATLLMAFIKK